MLPWRGASDPDLVESLIEIWRARIKETNARDRGGVETEEIWLADLRASLGKGEGRRREGGGEREGRRGRGGEDGGRGGGEGRERVR